MILVSTHDEREFARLIESSPAVGFLAKTELSAERIYRLLDRVRRLTKRAVSRPAGRTADYPAWFGIAERRPQEGDDGEHATVVLVGLRQTELGHDVVHVILDRSLGDP